MTASVAQRWQALREEIDSFASTLGRAPGSVAILGVSKKQSVEAICAAATAGLHAIGENYVQEAREKFPDLPLLEKHFIGHLQTNKARSIAALFDAVQSIDRLEAVTALGRAAASLGKVLPVLIQINISPNERFGCPPQEAPMLQAAIVHQPSLRYDGIMAIGPTGVPEKEIAAAYACAAKTFALLGGSTLSIGMSGDWREAVRAGSTMVRIGTALFGERRGGPK